MTENLENFLMDLIKGQVSVRAISRVQARRRFMSVVGRSIVVRAFRRCSRRSPFDLRPRVPAFRPPGGGVGPRVVVASTARCAYSPVSRARRRIYVAARGSAAGAAGREARIPSARARPPLRRLLAVRHPARTCARGCWFCFGLFGPAHAGGVGSHRLPALVGFYPTRLLMVESNGME